MAKVTIQTISITIDHATNYGQASKQACTQIAEVMGLSLVTVKTNTTSVYSAEYCYNNDPKLQIRLYNSSYLACFSLLRKDSSGNLSEIANGSLTDLSYSSNLTYYLTFRLVTAGTLKFIRWVTNSSSYYGFGVANMLNVYDAKTYSILMYSSGSLSINFYTLLDDYTPIQLSRYPMSDTTMPYDGKLYLIPIKFGNTNYSIMGSPGDVSYYSLQGFSMYGGETDIKDLPSGVVLSVGGTSVVYLWSYTYIGLE